jgi:hypothetical protein
MEEGHLSRSSRQIQLLQLAVVSKIMVEEMNSAVLEENHQVLQVADFSKFPTVPVNKFSLILRSPKLASNR